MAFGIGIMVAVVAGGAAVGAGLPFFARMWGYYATGGTSPETWEDMESGGPAEKMWGELVSSYESDFSNVENIQYLPLYF